MPDKQDKRLLWLSWLLLALMLAAVLATRPLTPIDETRYVSVAWEMWLRGDFLVPFKNGEVYSHKPPLLFWMFHLGWAVFGVNEWWPRSVGMLFGMGGAWLTWLMARRVWPERTGVPGMAALVLSSCAWWMLFATATMFDVMLAFCALVALHGLWSMAEGHRRGVWVMGLGIGLGVLAKGPVILLHVLPVALLAPWWKPGLRYGAWLGKVGLAVLIGAGIALAWAIPAGIAGGDAYRQAIFVGQTANRVVESFAHRRPFWWYLPVLPVMLFPWAVWPSFWRALARQRSAAVDHGLRFCLAWALPVFVAFCFVSGKQPHYLIPIIPAFALAVARLLHGRSENAGSVFVPALMVCAAGLALAATGQGMLAQQFPDFAPLPLVWPGVVVAAMAGVLWLLSRRGQTYRPLIMASLTLTLLTLAHVSTQAYFQDRFNVQPMAEVVKKAQQRRFTVATLGSYHAQFQFLGRLKNPLVELDVDNAEAIAWLQQNRKTLVVMYARNPDLIDADIRPVHRQHFGDMDMILVGARDAVRLMSRHPVNWRAN